MLQPYLSLLTGSQRDRKSAVELCSVVHYVHVSLESVCYAGENKSNCYRGSGVFKKPHCFYFLRGVSQKTIFVHNKGVGVRVKNAQKSTWFMKDPVRKWDWNLEILVNVVYGCHYHESLIPFHIPLVHCGIVYHKYYSKYVMFPTI